MFTARVTRLAPAVPPGMTSWDGKRRSGHARRGSSSLDLEDPIERRFGDAPEAREAAVRHHAL